MDDEYSKDCLSHWKSSLGSHFEISVAIVLKIKAEKYCYIVVNLVNLYKAMECNMSKISLFELTPRLLPRKSWGCQQQAWWMFSSINFYNEKEVWNGTTTLADYCRTKTRDPRCKIYTEIIIYHFSGKPERGVYLSFCVAYLLILLNFQWIS